MKIKKTTRRCPSCKKVLQLTAENFYRNKTKTAGFKYDCKKCFNKKSLECKGTPDGKFYSYKDGAKRRHKDWSLTKEQFGKFWQHPCTYCGSEIKTVGIDRIDSSKGYSESNCTSCCRICNMMKSDLTTEEFMLHIRRIINLKK